MSEEKAVTAEETPEPAVDPALLGVSLPVELTRKSLSDVATAWQGALTALVEAVRAKYLKPSEAPAA